MKNEFFASDMAVEVASLQGFEHLVDIKKLAYGIVKRTLLVKNLQQERQISRPRGKYITFDFPQNLNEASQRYLSKLISQALIELGVVVKQNYPILIVGLGNGNILADALGVRTMQKVAVTTDYNVQGQRVCAFSTGVLGTTGMQSADMVSAISAKIKASAVVLVDSLATSNLSRLGRSFQLSNTGISPGSGVGKSKERIDKSILQVPVFTIGVPLMLSLRLGLYNFVKELEKSEDFALSEFALRQRLANQDLSDLIVTAQNVDFLLARESKIIADAINMTFKKSY